MTGGPQSSPGLLTAEKAVSLPIPLAEGSIHAYITGRNRPAVDGSSILTPTFIDHQLARLPEYLDLRKAAKVGRS